MKKSSLIYGVAGFILIFLVSAYRLPRIYTPLWEDEIHHHYPILCSPSFIQMRRDIVYQNKAVLDYTLRRILFRTLLTPTERDLHLVSLLFSAAHLALLLFYPWSKRWFPRFVAAACLAANGLENSFSTEAQYYALSSVMGTLPFLALHWSLKKKASPAQIAGGLGLLAALFLSANTNYFNAPLLLVVFFVYAFALVKDPIFTRAWKAPATLWGIGIPLSWRLTSWLNKYSLRQMRSFPMAPAKHPVFSIMKNMNVLDLNYTLMGLAAWMFYGLVALSLVNRERVERTMGLALAFTLLVAKPLFFAYYSYKSDLPVFDRYTIMYIGPVALAVGLGVSSLIGWIDLWARPLLLRLVFLLPIYVYPLVHWRDPMKEWLTSVPLALSAWQSHPANDSRDYHFFERVKSLDNPLLVLIDHDWCSDIPLLYLKGGIGKPHRNGDLTVLDTGTTPPEAWRQKAEEFQSRHRKDGVVAYFFERGVAHSGACRGSAAPLYEWPSATGCLAIFRARDLPSVPPLGKLPAS